MKRLFSLGLVTFGLLLAAPAFAQTDPDAVAKTPKVEGGFTVNLGTAFGGNFAGATVGLGGQIGARVSPLFGAYYQGTVSLMVLSGGSSAMGSIGFDGGMSIYNSALASFYLGKRLELAAGPSLDVLMVSTPNSEGNPMLAFGVAAKAALHFNHFTLALDVHPSFRNASAFEATGLDPLTTATIGIGGNW